MAHVFGVAKVQVLDSSNKEVGFASGSAIHSVIKDFVENGKGFILSFKSPANEEVRLVMSHGGDLQVEYP